MITIRAILGGIFLFLGRELNFLFAAGMAALVALRLNPVLPGTWPAWADTAVLVTLAVIAAVIPFIHERTGYVVSGALAGGYFLSEYFAPGGAGFPILPLIVGAGIGGAVMGIFTDWALMLVTSLIGSFFIMDLFTFDRMTETLVSGGLFIVGALTQVIVRRMQQK
jgi:hypothetical protein